MIANNNVMPRMLEKDSILKMSFLLTGKEMLSDPTSMYLLKVIVFHVGLRAASPAAWFPAHLS